MAREILFKAKRKDNGEWVEGAYFPMTKYPTKENHALIWVWGEGSMGCDYDMGYTPYRVDETTICQYTGLTDKNGNKIWENDVVKCVDVNIEAEFFAVVEFGNPNGYYSWGYQLKHIWGDEPNLDILLWIDMEETGATCEVIGNKFDNPELIKGE